MTASRTCRSRSVREAAMSSNLLAANNLAMVPGPGQVAHEGVEAEPALRPADQPLVSDLHPPLLHPSGGRRRERAVEGGQGQAGIRPQRQIHALEFPLLLGQGFLGGDGRPPRREGATIRLPRREIPAACAAVERVRRGPESHVGAARPVCGIVTRALAVARRVGDLVEVIAASRKPHVSQQVLVRVAPVVRGRRGTASASGGSRDGVPPPQYRVSSARSSVSGRPTPGPWPGEDTPASAGSRKEPRGTAPGSAARTNSDSRSTASTYSRAGMRLRTAIEKSQ